MNVERKMSFLHLANEAQKHISLHRDRIHALLSAHKGILTPALISPKQLKAIIDWTMQTHFHQPLVHDTLLYYNLAAVHVIEQFVVALIPFNGDFHYQLYTLRPFPVMANNTAIIWDHPETSFIVSDTTLAITFLPQGVDKDCVLIADVYICNIPLLVEPMHHYPCLHSLLSDVQDEKESCIYKEFRKSFTFSLIENELLIFSNSSVKADIVCNSRKQQTMLYNVKSIPVSCSVNIPDKLSYHPSKIFKYDLNFTHFVRNYTSKFAEPEIERLTLRFRKKLDHVPIFWTYYQDSIAPYFGFVNLILIVIACIATFFLIRCIVIRRYVQLGNLITPKEGNASLYPKLDN